MPSRTPMAVVMGGGTFIKVGGAQMQVKKSVENFCGLNWKL